jgi:hypothetical protein
MASAHLGIALLTLMGGVVLACTSVLGIDQDYRLALGGAGGSGGVLDNCPAPTDPPGGACPAECSGGCAGAICTIDCDGGGCPDAMSACPAGFDCVAQCNSNGECNGLTLTCPAAASCTLVCNGNNGCMGATLVCADGPCEMVCGGNPSTCDGAVLQCGSGRCTCSGNKAVDVQCGASCGCYAC